MRLDPTDLRYLTPDEFRILTAVEMGSKNHEVVPTSLIAEISGVRGGNVNKLLGGLAKRNLVARVQNARYDGYRLTYGGLDFLALRAFSRRKPASVSSVGKKIGVGKESDIYVVKDDLQDSRVLKLHRLGRISFRAIKSKRDYLGKRKAASWMYMSRLAAQKEFALMKALYSHGFPVPIPIDQARHCIVMSLIDSYPLRSIESVPDPGELYSQLMALIVDLAHAGLIHGDFNEFNILIRRKTYEPVVIDFPQMVSTRHENAEYFFNRDVNCIRRFFRRRLHFEGTSWPLWKDVLADLKADEEAERAEAAAAQEKAAEAGGAEKEGVEGGKEDGTAGEVKEEVDVQAEAQSAPAGVPPRKRIRIDLEVEASGFGRALQQELEEDMPDSEPEDGEEDDEDEGEHDNDNDDEAEPDIDAATPTDDPSAPSEPFDEEAFQAQMAARMEALRLHKALGNDDPAEADESEDDGAGAEYDSDSSSAVSDETPQSDFTTYSRATSGRGRGRGRGGALGRSTTGSGSGSVAGSVRGVPGRKDDLRMQVARRVEKELLGGASAGTTGGGAGQGKAKVKDKVGRAKGHKWKANPKHLVGGRGDGWD